MIVARSGANGNVFVINGTRTSLLPIDMGKRNPFGNLLGERGGMHIEDLQLGDKGTRRRINREDYRPSHSLAYD